MAKLLRHEYDADARRLTLTFVNGRTMVVSNMSHERALIFVRRHGEEFAKRDACLETPTSTGCVIFTR